MRNPLDWIRRPTDGRRRGHDEPADGPDSPRSLFRNFRRILDLNTSVLGIMASLERAQGGEYIFDRAFLQSAVRDAGALVRQVVYSLNSLSGDQYIPLYDRFQAVQSSLEDILAGGLGPLAGRPTLSLAEAGWETEPLVGQEIACLAELRRRRDLPVPDGFVVTVEGCRRLKASGDDAELATAVAEEISALFARRGGPCALTVTAHEAGAGGTVRLGGDPAWEPVEPAGLAMRLAEAMAWAGPGAAEAGLCLAVREAVRPRLSGVIKTSARDSDGPGPRVMSVEAWPAGDEGRAERYLMERAAPFALVRSEIKRKAIDAPTPYGRNSQTVMPSGLRRGSALLPPGRLRFLAEEAMAVERALDGPREVAWAMDASGGLFVLGVGPAAPASMDGQGREDDDLGAAMAKAVVLLKGGETAQAGVAAGRIAHVREDDDPAAFPVGAVAVARTASPRLSPILRRASALVTEVGTPIGHLATVARELRVPALLGAAGALALLPHGAEATVDAGEGVVYAGAIQPLLDYSANSGELSPSDPEYLMLRRLLRFILPLELTDPDAPGFTPEGCRSYHDIIHFAHERAVAELMRLQERGDHGLAALPARRLAIDAPIAIRVLDLGGGLAEGTENGDVRPEEVASEPLAAFLAGLARREAWSVAPAPVGLRDILAGIGRSRPDIQGGQDKTGASLAIAARCYCNLSLRLGYHFTVVDSFLGDNPNQNHIYFRFAGGFADDRRRALRAGMVRAILESLDFKVQVKGDLVTGSLKLAERPEMALALERLGELTGFSRQLDLSMDSEDDAERRADEFLAMVRSASRRIRPGDGEEG